MPRNNAGSYTLPSGTPYVTGTTISSTVVNSVNSDVAVELTNSLDRNGRGQMLAPLPLSDGSVSAPALTFSSEPSSGLYRAGTNDLRIVIGGNSVLQATAAGAFALFGLTVTTNVTNGVGVTTTGNGTGAGLAGTGGGLGAPGVTGTGTISAAGVVGTGGPTNGVGVSGVAKGNAQGGLFVGAGTGEGVNATGGASGGVGVVATPGTSGTAAINSVGNILLTGATLAGAPNVSIGGPSTVTYATATRVAGSISIAPHAVGAQTILASYNVASAVLQANRTDLLVTFANYVASSATSYWVTLSVNKSFSSALALVANWNTKTTSSFIINLCNSTTGALIDLTNVAGIPVIDFEVKGF